MRVALVVRFVSGVKRSEVDLPLTSAQCGLLSVCRKGKRAGLRALEKAGLVRVRRAYGKNPLVSIVELKEGE